MNNNVEKFVALMQEDQSLRERLISAMENYSGDQSIEATFQNILRPLAKENGCDFTLEDLQEYIQLENASLEEMKRDELKQIAGGGADGVGFGVSACAVIGLGVGSQGDIDMKTGKLTEVGICGGIGVGFGAGACIYSGSAKGL